MIPKGYIINCPCCGKPLYKVVDDVQITESIFVSLPKIVGIFPQPLIKAGDLIVQKCHYCERNFDFLELIKSYWISKMSGGN